MWPITRAPRSARFAIGSGGSARSCARRSTAYLRGQDTAKYLQDQIVTERNGRFVLLVKAEHRASLPGLVHGSSASGQTLYLEPLATVEINNEVVSLEAEEAEEVLRILLELTDGFRSRRDEVSRERACRNRARRAAGQGAAGAGDRRRGALARPRRPPRAAGGTASAADEGRRVALFRRPRRAAGRADTCRHQTGAARDDAAHHRSQHRRQDGRPQDGRPAGADGAGGAAHSGRAGLGGAGLPSRSLRTSATSSPSRRA